MRPECRRGEEDDAVPGVAPDDAEEDTDEIGVLVNETSDTSDMEGTRLIGNGSMPVPEGMKRLKVIVEDVPV